MLSILGPCRIDVASKFNKNNYTYLDDAVAQAGFQHGDLGSLQADFT
jgi:hypothetical protein